MELATPDQLKPKPPVSSLVFGKHFTDHMLTIDWCAAKGWASPRIAPVQPLAIHPAAKVLHYALEVGAARQRLWERGNAAQQQRLVCNCMLAFVFARISVDWCVVHNSAEEASLP